MSKPRILLTGARGQLATAVAQSHRSELGELVAVDRTQFDLSQSDSLAAKLDEIKPQIIINTAAYTAVDKAQTEVDLAYAVNAHAPGEMANWCARNSALLIHYSTDYVFDGSKRSPWLETDEPRPLSVYGASKLEGEQRIAQAIEQGAAAITLRTSWVYASHGKNFFLTMLKLAAQKPELTVVDDQLGAPTTVDFLAEVTRGLLALSPQEAQAASGIYHCTMSGEVTWRGFAQTIIEQAHARGLLSAAIPVHATTTAVYNAPAPRPLYSVMSNRKRVERFGGTAAATSLSWGEGLMGLLRQKPSRGDQLKVDRTL
jgi:dTDP-4-dehydrorhamnose reductase